MLELGAEASALHANLARGIEAARVDLVFLCGGHMRVLWDALPSSRRGAHGETSAELTPAVLGALRAGDVALIKGSFGSRMAVIVEALKTLRTSG